MILGHGNHIERALRKTAQLRTLTVSLRRASESTERERLRSEFESFLQRIETNDQDVVAIPLPSTDVLLAGIRMCWARGDHATIRNLAGLLPRNPVDQGALLRAYVAAVGDH